MVHRFRSSPMARDQGDDQLTIQAVRNRSAVAIALYKRLAKPTGLGRHLGIPTISESVMN